MKLNTDKIFKYLEQREQIQGQWETIVRWGIAVFALGAGLYTGEWQWTFGILLVLWFMPVIVIPWINGKVTGSQWYINLRERNQNRIAGYPKYIRWPIQGSLLLALFWLMNGFKFWPIG